MKLTGKDLLEMYETMNLIRSSEQMMYELHNKGQILGHMLPCMGQEAVPVAIAKIMKDSDILITGHRGGGHYIARGCSFERMWAEFFGRETGICRGRGGQLHLMDISHRAMTGNAIVAAQWGIAAGAGFAAKATGDMVVVAGGEGSTNRGPFHESLNMCSVKKLPVLFVVENNNKMMWSEGKEYMGCERVASRAAGYGVPGATVDGNDVQAVYEKALEYAEYIRSGKGPCLLECITAKFRDTVGNLRDTPEHIEYLKDPSREPIGRLATKLREMGVLNDDLEAEIQARVQKKLDDAIEFARQSPIPDMYDGHDQVFSQPV
jgi:TPP-dependent pyruvate/acetoin dehydrogenase alpha subunit